MNIAYQRALRIVIRHSRFAGDGGCGILSMLNVLRRNFMKPSKLGYFAVCALVALFGASMIAAPPAGGYHLLKKISFGAAPGGGEYFDYVTLILLRAAFTFHTARSSSWLMPIRAPR